MFGLFAQAMPLTIIGNTFYHVHITQERLRQKLHGKFKLRKAVFKTTSTMTMYSCDSAIIVNSGYENLHKSLKMKSEHHEIIDEYLDMKREDIHKLNTVEKMRTFSQLHDRVAKIVALYLHSSDAHIVMKKQEEIARQLVESQSSEEGESESKQKLILTTFRHLSTRYIDGMSFHELHGSEGERSRFGVLEKS